MVGTVAALAALLGILQVLIGFLLVRRFAAAPRTAAAAELPPVSVLKPLHGAEPLLEESLASTCAQDYPRFQVVFGVQEAGDPAIGVVRRLQARFPGCDIELVIDATEHGPNRKVSNLINMLPTARHDVIVIADSDVHVPPDWLRRVVASLTLPGAALATALYSGLPAHRGLAAQLGASQINYCFLPGALLARALGRQDCLGATMALRRETLAAIGGFGALVRHLADDNELGRLAQALGEVRLIDPVPATTVAEASLGALFVHELRWARTIRALVPAQFAASVLQYPLFWSAAAAVASGGAGWALGLFAVAWAVRAGVARGIDATLGLAIRAPVWLLPLRDAMSVAVLLASYGGDRVTWREHRLRAAVPATDPGE